MEPNQDDRIREKIREAEQNPVSWNKDEVWNRVNPQPKKERSHAVYYAAASLAALMAMSMYAWVVYQDHEYQIRMSSLELAIEKARSSSLQETRIAEVPVDCKEPLPSTLQADKQLKSVQKFEQPVAATNPEQETRGITQVEVVTTSPSEKSADVAEVPTPAQKVEEPIVSTTSREFTPTVITIQPEPAKPQVVVARTRKLKLHFFRKNEPEYDLRGDRKDDILFANIH